jgi:phospholipid/cholesterol/gamma-HCH transport system substrate-binding protein
MKGKLEFSVGFLILLAAIALMFMAIRVSGLSSSSFTRHTYELKATFSNIGDLKIRAPIRLAGVNIGQVSGIDLDPDTFEAKVTLTIEDNIDTLPTDTSAAIAQAGLLGDNYVSLTPGFGEKILKPGDHIETTYAATNISSLISTFMSGGGPKNDKP